ncbi:putative glucan 1,3-beta-glucosidase A [Senna tora]|uniref:Putative glucan 1,3-beta-glucosidase A n=1 Tax=Senna tora TaxID=362788 RepID=A0A834T807_9FABA|nr:putative glucan 1,3-beta-glucosidase A [Senna tora]
MNESTFRIRVHKDQFVGLDGIQVVAVANSPTHSETFEIIKESNVSNRVRIKVSNGFFLQAKTKNLVTADVSEVSGWKNNDPTIFNLTIVSQINGDWQLQNGYGPEAPRVMKKHYDTFITKKDFKFMKENGINTVRIPVGWWTTKDPNPPFPFVRGTLRALDNAFSWAKEYKLKVILDLHSAPYSQNGVATSTTRDGSLKWGQTNETIQQTLEVIDFFAARYEKHKSLYGIELLNEPLYPCVPLKIIEEYYRTAYSVVRRYNPEVYVILSSRVSFTLADMPSPQELFPLANSLENSVVDVHWYHLYYDIFTDMKSVKEHFDYIEHNRTKQMTELLEKSGKARIYIGEWSAAWDVENATKEENVQNNWSLKWLIENGYIKLPVSKPEMISSAMHGTGNVSGGRGLETRTASVAVDATLHREWVRLWPDGCNHCWKHTHKQHQPNSSTASHVFRFGITHNDEDNNEMKDLGVQ